jgi:hypothetical protein
MHKSKLPCFQCLSRAWLKRKKPALSGCEVAVTLRKLMTQQLQRVEQQLLQQADARTQHDTVTLVAAGAMVLSVTPCVNVANVDVPGQVGEMCTGCQGHAAVVALCPAVIMYHKCEAELACCCSQNKPCEPCHAIMVCCVSDAADISIPLSPTR